MNLACSQSHRCAQEQKLSTFSCSLILILMTDDKLSGTNCLIKLLFSSFRAVGITGKPLHLENFVKKIIYLASRLNLDKSICFKLENNPSLNSAVLIIIIIIMSVFLERYSM